MEMDTTENFSTAWNPKVSNVLGMGFCHGNARLWHLPFELPLNKWEVTELKKRWQALNYPGRNDLDGAKKDIVLTTEWSSDGSLLATACTFGSVRIWSSSGMIQRNLEGHTGPIVTACFSPSGSRILTIGIDRKTIIWDTNSGKQIQMYQIRKVVDCHWLNDDIFAVSAELGVLVWHIKEPQPVREYKRFTGKEINTLRFERNNTCYLACGSDDAKVYFFDIRKEDPIKISSDHKSGVHTLRWAPQGRYMASIGYDQKILVTDINAQTVTLCFENNESFSSAEFSPNSHYIAAAAFDGKVFVWSVETGGQLISFSYNKSFYEIRWNSTGEWLASSAPKFVMFADLRDTIKNFEKKGVAK